MRTRSRYSNYKGHEGIKTYQRITDYWSGDLIGNYTTTRTSAGVTPLKYEWMADMSTTPGIENPVSHRTLEIQVDGSVSVSKQYIQWSWRYDDRTAGDSVAWLQYLVGDNWLQGLATQGSYDPIDIARFSFEPEMTSQSFYGIEAAKDLFNALNSARKFKVTKAFDYAYKAFRRLRKPRASLSDVKRILSGTSDGFLAWNFGVKPMVSDIRTLRTLHGNWRRDIQSVPSTKRKVSSAMKSNSLTSEASLPPISSPAIRAALTQQVSTDRIGGLVTIPANAATRTFSRYLADHLRLTDVVGLAWEFIPFSFAIDWFLHIDDRIQSSRGWFTSSVMPAAALDNRCMSRKIVEKQELYLDTSTGLWTCPNARVKIGDLLVTSYLRNYPGLDAGFTLSSSGYGRHQQLLSAALLWQKVRKLIS